MPGGGHGRVCRAAVAQWTPDLAAASCDRNSRSRPSGRKRGHSALSRPGVSRRHSDTCFVRAREYRFNAWLAFLKRAHLDTPSVCKHVGPWLKAR